MMSKNNGSNWRKQGLNGLMDMFPALATKNYAAAVEKMEELLKWLGSQQTSKLEFVEVGFDSLDPTIIDKLVRHVDHMKRSFQPLNLKEVSKNKKQQELHMSQAYAECFPFWSPPHSSDGGKVESFKIGARIMNINSSLSGFVPFGFRGTVVGKTDNQLIVIFDEQFLGGGRDVLKKSKFRGARVYAQNCINLTKRFTEIA